MRRKKQTGIGTLGLGVVLWVTMLIGPAAWARVIHVPADYAKIRDAIDAAKDGDEVVVAPGIYRDDYVSLDGKAIVVRSTFNGDWGIVRNTIIDANGHYTPVGLNGEETSKSVVRGFTLTHGNGAIFSDGLSYENGYSSHATIEYNLIINNYGPGPNGVGTIENCSGLIQNNIIMGNIASAGSALSRCNGLIQNNIVVGNKAIGYSVPGYPLWPPLGGAFHKCDGTIRNNTVVDNYLRAYFLSAPLTPGGFKDCKGTIVNNIIDHTSMTQPLEFDGCSTPTYCLFRAPRPGQGNLAADPRFLNPAVGDYRLAPGSPAIDAGCAVPGLAFDFLGFSRPLRVLSARRGDGSGMDLGALESWTANATRPERWRMYD